MAEQTETQEVPVFNPLKPKQDLCSIRIIFPVSNEEEAIRVNKVIREATDGITDVVREFRITHGMQGYGR